VGILEQSMLWKLLKKNEKENVESESEKEKEKKWNQNFEKVRSPKDCEKKC
jgi:hypothetical protein